MVKNTVKSFVRENKFHTYLTRGTLSAGERVNKFHNHGKTSSYQTFADASMRKVVPKSYGSIWRDRQEGPSSFWDWDRVSRSSSWNCRPQSAELPKQHGGWCNLWMKTRFMLNTWDISINCKNYPLGEIFHSDLELTMRETCNVSNENNIDGADIDHACVWS